MIITSIDNEKIKSIKKLQSKKYRDETKLFIVEGKHLVEEAYKLHRLKSVYILDSCNMEFDVEVNTCSEKVMKYISELDTPTNIIGVCSHYTDGVIGNNVLALDNIQDPGNLGTIIRSAVAFNVDTILLSEDSVDVYNSKVIRASQGMIFHVNVIRANLKEILTQFLKPSGYTIYGTSIENVEVKKKINPERIVVIMGNEGNGIREEILSLCDEFIYIKMNKKCESLNVAVASSIIMHEMFGE